MSSIFEDPTARTADDALAAAEDAQATADRAHDRITRLLEQSPGLDAATLADVLEQLRDVRQTTADILRRLERYEARVDALPSNDAPCQNEDDDELYGTIRCHVCGDERNAKGAFQGVCADCRPPWKPGEAKR